MSNTYFQFQQFTIHHDRCAMKVGTDGVLLGAWAEVPEHGFALDIGTGSGLVALMIAQRSSTLSITGIDIDHESVLQARENVQSSPFATRISIEECSLQDYDAGHIFDTIVCNPPFFEETLLPPDAQRRDARHTCSLPFHLLAETTARMLRDGGTLSIVLPTSALPSFQGHCEQNGLHMSRLCHVRTTVRKEPKRILATFTKCPSSTAPSLNIEELVLQDGPHRTPDYKALTKDFYLY